MMKTCLECSYCLEMKDGSDKYCSAPVPAWCNTCYNDAVPFMKENDPKIAKDCPFFSREPVDLGSFAKYADDDGED